MVKHKGRDPRDGRPILTVDEGDSLEDLQRMAERSGIWVTPPVEQEPSVRVTHWLIYGWKGEEEAMVLACYHPAGREGRVSTPIVTIDKGQMRIKTSSGRIYELSGPPAQQIHPDTAWVMDIYFRGLGVDPGSFVDITPRIFPAFYGEGGTS